MATCGYWLLYWMVQKSKAMALTTDPQATQEKQHLIHTRMGTYTCDGEESNGALCSWMQTGKRIESNADP